MISAIEVRVINKKKIKNKNANKAKMLFLLPR